MSKILSVSFLRNAPLKLACPSCEAIDRYMIQFVMETPREIISRKICMTCALQFAVEVLTTAHEVAILMNKDIEELKDEAKVTNIVRDLKETDRIIP